MLQSGELKICRPAEAINELDRTKPRDRLMAYAVEHLMFSHPYKKFDLAMRGGWNDMGIDNIKVYDFEHSPCSIDFYQPDGDERNALQLEFTYDRNVHSKSPKDTKRTSNVSKILECVKLIKPAGPEEHRKRARAAKDLIEEATKFAACKRSFEGVFSGIAYDKVHTNIALFEALLNKQETTAVETLRKKFYDKHKDYSDAREYLFRLRKHSVMIVKNHSGDYRLVHRQVVKDETANKMVAKYSLSQYGAKSDIPPNIYGKLCLLEIAQQSDNNEHSIEGVGKVSKEIPTTPVYIIIGEDLEEPAINDDTRTQSQDEGD